MAKKVLIITGSPRVKGNSNKLAAAFASGATAAGKEVKYFDAAKCNMDGCHGDQSCFERGTCGLKDDGVQLHELMRWADVMVLVSPVYFKGFTSQIKRVIDRFYPYTAPKPRAALTIKETFLIATAGHADESVFKPMLEQFELVNKALKVECKGTLCVPGLGGVDAVNENEEALAKAAAYGFQI